MQEKRYGQWAGDPKGKPEDKSRCYEEIYGDFYVSYQCSRKRGYGKDGLYCKQHAKRHPENSELPSNPEKIWIDKSKNVPESETVGFSQI